MCKRALDIFLSTLLIILFAPLFVVAALAVVFGSGLPVFFLQKRVGLNEKIFTIIKFRSMSEKITSEQNESDRVTNIGKFLRRSSLDELPELLNVLKGDMSLVGPRPLLPEYLTEYNARQKLRHNVRPGITGWAQVNGRNELEWEDRLEMDVWYVENRTLILDLVILMLTVRVVLSGRGVNHSSTTIMSKFKRRI